MNIASLLTHFEMDTTTFYIYYHYQITWPGGSYKYVNKWTTNKNYRNRGCLYKQHYLLSSKVNRRPS